MKYKSVILPAAKEDLLEAAKWYNRSSAELGTRFIKRFRERMVVLRTNPLTCQKRYSDVHTALVEQFPYMIHYFVDQNKTIVVISILHSSRNPQIWNDRKPE